MMRPHFCLVVLLCGNVLYGEISQAMQIKDTDKDVLHRLDELDERTRIQQLELESLRKEYAEIRGNNKMLKSEVGELRLEATELRKQLTRLYNLNNTDKSSQGRFGLRQSDPRPTVAFFATRTTHALHLEQDQPIVFDNALTNLGQAYDSSTGVFTVPLSGVYMFSSTIVTHMETAHFKLTVNNKAVSTLVSYNSEIYETLSQTAILSLNKGDFVAIQSHDEDKLIFGSNLSSLAGFLLYSSQDVIVG